jgi:hypothetical protein
MAGVVLRAEFTKSPVFREDKSLQQGVQDEMHNDTFAQYTQRSQSLKAAFANPPLLGIFCKSRRELL